MTLSLRPYQRESIDALYSHWEKGGGDALIVLPTGAGKSLVLSKLCQELLADYPSLRIGIVSHVRELLTQTYQELVRLWGAAPVGLYSAGLSRRDARSKILICGIQSVWNKVHQIGSFDVLLIDEVHLVSKKSETMYGKFIRSLRDETPDMRLVGLSASPWRMDSGRLDRGKDRLFEKIVYEANIRDLIEQGYLCQLISKATATMLDVSGVGKRGGEFIQSELQVAVDHDWITKSAAAEIVKYGADRKAWLAFCAGVRHAEHMRDAIRELGYTCEMVTGDIDKGQRDRIIMQFNAGQIRCLTSVGVLSTGFNSPRVDLLALLRPSQSSSLFLQQCGRGLRNYPGKKDCLVLDFANLVKTHGPIDDLTTSSASGEKDARERALAKECPNCSTLVALAARRCPTCDFIWPDREEVPRHEAVADASTSILSKGAPAWVTVDYVRYYLHKKDGSPDSLRVEYHCGFTVHKEWLGFQHQGFMRQKAERFWLQAAYQPIPRTAQEALTRQKEIKQISAIQVRPDGKYFSVVGRLFPQPSNLQAAE